MSNFMYCSLPVFCGVISNPAATPRGRMAVNLYGAIYYSRYATDPIGTCVLTLTNVVIGSRIHITPQNDATNSLYDSVAGASTVPITLSVYSAGNALNDLRIRVRKGTAAPKYQPFETLATLTQAPQSIYIAQVPDLIA